MIVNAQRKRGGLAISKEQITLQEEVDELKNIAEAGEFKLKSGNLRGRRDPGL